MKHPSPRSRPWQLPAAATYTPPAAFAGCGWSCHESDAMAALHLDDAVGDDFGSAP